jgi:predicted dehydrogenase
MAGGALFDIGIYCINAARYLFQAEPEAVLGCVIGGEDKRFREVDGSVAVTLYFSEDRIATFYASFAAFPRSQFEIIGTRGRITADPAYEYAEGLAYTIQTRKRSREVQAKKHDQFAAELKYFAECIRTGKKVEPDGEEGLADLRIIEAIRHSSSERKIVKLAQFRTDYPTKRLAQRISPTRKATRLVAVQRASK